NYAPELVDEVIGVEASEAYAAAREVLHEEGLLVGPSSGANLEAAARLAQRPEHEGTTIVVILADTGERYLSAGVFGPRPAGDSGPGVPEEREVPVPSVGERPQAPVRPSCACR